MLWALHLKTAVVSLAKSVPVAVPATALLAQAADTTLAGSSGWVGAGILGSVLAWIFFVHLPAKDKQLEAKDRLLVSLMAAKDAQLDAAMAHKWATMQTMMTEHGGEMKTLSQEFRAAIQVLSEHCDKENERMVGLLEESRRRNRAVPGLGSGGP